MKHSAGKEGLDRRCGGAVNLQRNPQGRGRSRQQDKRRGVSKEGEWVVGCDGAGQDSIDARQLEHRDQAGCDGG